VQVRWKTSYPATSPSVDDSITPSQRSPDARNAPDTYRATRKIAAPTASSASVGSAMWDARNHQDVADCGRHVIQDGHHPVIVIDDAGFGSPCDDFAEGQLLMRIMVSLTASLPHPDSL
jgi:hypothetical protein